MNIKSWESLAILIGTVVGAGVLSLPYVFSKVGFLTGLLITFVVGFFVLFLYLYCGEIIARTKGKHQLTGYCQKYLGLLGKNLMLVSMMVGCYGALIAYLLGIGESFVTIFGGSKIFFIISFFLIFSTLVILGLRTVAGSELLTSSIFIGLLLLIMGFTFPSFNSANVLQFDISRIFIPLGPVLFAFLGFAAVPEAFENLSVKKDMKKILFFGILIPFILYVLFCLSSVAAIGPKLAGLLGDEAIVTVALSSFLDSRIAVLGNFFAIFAMSSSFLTLALALKQVWNYDYNINNTAASLMTLLPPILIVFLGVTDFIQIIGISGIVAGFLDALLIVLMIKKAKKFGDRKPEFSIPYSHFFGFLIVTVFLVGSIYYLFF